MAEPKSEFDGMTDDQLSELEQQLYDAEFDGADTWFERDKVLWEMNRRGMMDRRS